ncbi:MAG: DUF357 domain-containing protein [Candidatus Bathyarchaeia archaeon]
MEAFSENPKERARTYIKSFEEAIETVKILKIKAIVDFNEIDGLLNLSKNYLIDAKHYLEKDKPVTALASISYAEGLIDALRFLKIISIPRWNNKK